MSATLETSGLSGKALADAILREEAARRRVTVREAMSGSLRRAPVRTRQATAARLYALKRPDGSARFSMPRIASLLGYRDHTTILHAIRAHEKRTGGQG